MFGLCENSTAPDHNMAEQLVYGIALPSICFLGVFANIFNIVILCDRHLAAPTYTYLLFLAIADLITLVLYFIDLVSGMHFYNQSWYHFFQAHIYLPLGSISTSSSLLLTVAVTIDRYIFIQNPAAITSHAVPISVQLQGPRKRARKIGAAVCLLATALNIPRMAAWYFDSSTGCRKAREWSKDKDGWFSIYSYLRLLFINIGSILLMALFNFLLILLVRRSTARRERCQSLSSGNSTSSSGGNCKPSSSKRKNRQFNRANMSLTLTLIAATLLALSGEVPSTIFSRISASVIWRGEPDILDREPFKYFVLMGYALVLIEYSGNFVIYCVLNKRFRLVFVTKFLEGGKHHHKSHHHHHHHHHNHRGHHGQQQKDGIFTGESGNRKKSFSFDNILSTTKNPPSICPQFSHQHYELDIQKSEEETDNMVTMGDKSPDEENRKSAAMNGVPFFSAANSPQMKQVQESRSMPSFLVRASCATTTRDGQNQTVESILIDKSYFIDEDISEDDLDF